MLTASNTPNTWLVHRGRTATTIIPTPTTAASGTATVGSDNSLSVVLSGVSPQTIYFSDRPARLTGTVATADFASAKVFDPSNPPNAALVVAGPPEDVLVVELTSPAYDPDAQTMTYSATLLADYPGDALSRFTTQQDDDSLPAEFGPVSLFVDEVTCLPNQSPFPVQPPDASCPGDFCCSGVAQWFPLLPVGAICVCEAASS